MCALEQMQLAVPTGDIWLRILARHANARVEPRIKRKSQRYRVEFGVVQLFYECSGRTRDYTASLLQISAHGMMIRNHTRIAVGTPLRMKVTLDRAPVTLNGRVAHCTETVGAFKIGIRLQFEDRP
jgi:hypothetical protein